MSRLHYGDDTPPPRIRKVEDLHAKEVLVRGAIIDEFRAVFNLASYFADVIFKLDPNHIAVTIASAEGMLGRFDALYKQEQSPSVSAMPEGGVLSVPVPERDPDSGSGAGEDGEAPSSGDSMAQGCGTLDAWEDGAGSRGSSNRGGEQLSLFGDGGEAVATGSEPSVGEGV